MLLALFCLQLQVGIVKKSVVGLGMGDAGRDSDGRTVINFRTQMTTSYAELGETCVATTAQHGIVIFFCCAYATAAFRPVMPISILRDARTSLDATLAKCRCVVACAEEKVLYHSAGVVDTRLFAKIRVSQGVLN